MANIIEIGERKNGLHWLLVGAFHHHYGGGLRPPPLQWNPASSMVDGELIPIANEDHFLKYPIWTPRLSMALSVTFLRFGRVFRMGRMTQVLHTMEHLREMRILIQTLIVSVRGLVWSVFLIGGIVLAASIVMVQLSHSFLFDESIPFERRKWMYNSFGTIFRSCYSMFECTFTGQWPRYAYPYIEEVHSAFAFFFMPIW